MQRGALLVSAIFHPLIMPLACFVVASQFDWYIRGTTDPNVLRLALLVVALSTIAFPGANMLLLRWYGVLSSLEMPGRAERLAPFLSTLFFFGLGYYLLRKGALPLPMYSIFTGSMIALTSLTLVNLVWKISAHATGVGGLLGATVGLFHIHNYGNLALLSWVLIITGATLTARLILKAHSPAQVYAGAATGFLALYLAVVNSIFI